MKTISTLLALLYHLVLGIGRLAMSLIIGVISLLGVIAIVLKVAVRFIWRKFAKGYQETWNVLYSRLGKPTCKICGKAKAKDRIVTYHECCKKWAHNDCHVSEKVAHMIVKGDNVTAAAYMTLGREGAIPLAYSTLVLVLRTLISDPYRPGLYARIARVKKLSNGMGVFDAMLAAMIG